MVVTYSCRLFCGSNVCQSINSILFLLFCVLLSKMFLLFLHFILIAFHLLLLHHLFGFKFFFLLSRITYICCFVFKRVYSFFVHFHSAVVVVAVEFFHFFLCARRPDVVLLYHDHILFRRNHRDVVQFVLLNRVQYRYLLMHL